MTQSVVFDRAAEFYDETRAFPPGVETPAAALIAQAGQFTPHSQVLEIGIGTGRIALPVSQHVGAYFGLDLSRLMMNRLRLKQNGEAIFPVQGDATRLPYPTHSLDAVIAVHVFHLIPNWQDAVNEVGRVLKPGAPLIHCWTKSDDIFSNLLDACRSALPKTREIDVGVRFEHNDTFLIEHGWREGDIHQLDYAFERAPRELREAMKNRIWSHTWRLSDEELALGLAAMDEVMAREYPNPEEPQTVKNLFLARAFYPPAA